MMTKEDFFRLIDKHLAGQTTDQEKQQLINFTSSFQQADWDEALLGDPLLVKTALYEQLRQSLGLSSPDVVSLPATGSAPPIHRVHFLRRGLLRYAAAVILIAGIAAYFWMNKRDIPAAQYPDNNQPVAIAPGSNKAILTIGNNKPIDLSNKQTGITVNNNIHYNNGDKIADAGQMLQLKTPRGGQYQAILPDGTKVWLNAESEIKFPSRFEGDTREVGITGEAYLEVAQNSRQAFIVHTSQTTVEVLGTSFNINAYGNETVLQTTLITGSVRVKTSDDQALVLKPGQQASVDAASRQLKMLDRVNTDDITAWRSGFFNFTGADLPAIMRQLERWYDIKVEYAGAVPTFSFQGRLDRNVNLSQVLDMLTKMEVKLHLKGRTLIIE